MAEPEKSQVHRPIREVPTESGDAIPTMGADFSDLVGKWVPDPAFDDVIASQRKIDATNWERKCCQSANEHAELLVRSVN